MAETEKVRLDQAWIYQGKTYGPGQVEIPAGLAEILRKRGRLPTEEGTLPAATAKKIRAALAGEE